jgi:hypothetical protein
LPAADGGDIRGPFTLPALMGEIGARRDDEAKPRRDGSSPNAGSPPLTMCVEYETMCLRNGDLPAD